MNLYFSYNEEIDPANIKSIAKSATFYGVGKCNNFRFVINKMGLATVQHSANSLLYGVVWNVSKNDMYSIGDFRKDLSDTDQSLIKIQVTFPRNPQNIVLSSRTKHHKTNSVVMCQLYKDSFTTIGTSSKEYLATITSQLSKYGVPQDYLQEIHLWSL